MLNTLIPVFAKKSASAICAYSINPTVLESPINKASPMEIFSSFAAAASAGGGASVLVWEGASVVFAVLTDCAVENRQNRSTATIKMPMVASVIALDFFITLTSQNLKYKNGSSKPRYIQYTLAPNKTASMLHITTLFFKFFKMRNGSFAESKIPAIKKG